MVQQVHKLLGDASTTSLPKRKSLEVPPPLPSEAVLVTDTPYDELVRRRRNYLEKKRIHARKDSIQSMQQTVRELEKRYESLCSIADAVRKEKECKEQTQTRVESQLSVHQLTVQTSPHRASLHALVKEVHYWIHENARLRELIDHQTHFQHCVRSMAEEAKLERSLASGMEFLQFGKFCYVPFTRDDCHAVLRKVFAQHVATRPDFDDPDINQKLPFDWRGRVYYENDRLFRFQMTKDWPGSAEVNRDTMYNYVIAGLDAKPDKNHVYYEQHRMGILQHISDDIKIGRRLIPLQGWISWTVFVAYRARVGDAFLFGCVPLPLWGNGRPVGIDDEFGSALLDEHESMAIRPIHHLFEPVVTVDGEVRTRVRRWGSVACDQSIFMPVFFQSTVETILRFEQLVLRSRSNLIQS